MVLKLELIKTKYKKKEEKKMMTVEWSELEGDVFIKGKIYKVTIDADDGKEPFEALARCTEVKEDGTAKFEGVKEE